MFADRRDDDFAHGMRKDLWAATAATFHGSKRAAQAKLAELISAVDKGAHVSRSALTVGEHVLERNEQWTRLGKLTPKSAERYRELADNQIAPHLGAIGLQDLKASHIERWHATLRVRAVRMARAA